MTDNTVDFTSRLTRGGTYMTLRIPVRELPRTMQARPARMQIQVIPQARLSTSTNVGTPTYLLALQANQNPATSDASSTQSSKP